MSFVGIAPLLYHCHSGWFGPIADYIVVETGIDVELVITAPEALSNMQKMVLGSNGKKYRPSPKCKELNHDSHL